MGRMRPERQAHNALAMVNAWLADHGIDHYRFETDASESLGNPPGQARIKMIHQSSGERLQWMTDWIDWASVTVWAEAYYHAQRSTREQAGSVRGDYAPRSDWLIVRNWGKRSKRKRWWYVLVFEQEPTDGSPRESKQGVELARFRGQGEAWGYARDLARTPGSFRGSWGVVIR